MSQALYQQRAERIDVLSGGKGRGQQQPRYRRYLNRANPAEKKEEAVEEGLHWAQILGEMELADRVRGIWLGSLGREVELVAPVANDERAPEEWALPARFQQAVGPLPTGQTIDPTTIALQRMNGLIPQTPVQPPPPSGNAFAADLPMMHLQRLSLGAVDPRTNPAERPAAD